MADYSISGGWQPEQRRHSVTAVMSVRYKMLLSKFPTTLENIMRIFVTCSLWGGHGPTGLCLHVPASGGLEKYWTSWLHWHVPASGGQEKYWTTWLHWHVTVSGGLEQYWTTGLHWHVTVSGGLEQYWTTGLWRQVPVSNETKCSQEMIELLTGTFF